MEKDMKKGRWHDAWKDSQFYITICLIDQAFNYLLRCTASFHLSYLLFVSKASPSLPSTYLMWLPQNMARSNTDNASFLARFLQSTTSLASTARAWHSFLSRAYRNKISGAAELSQNPCFSKWAVKFGRYWRGTAWWTGRSEPSNNTPKQSGVGLVDALSGLPSILGTSTAFLPSLVPFYLLLTARRWNLLGLVQSWIKYISYIHENRQIEEMRRICIGGWQ